MLKSKQYFVIGVILFCTVVAIFYFTHSSSVTQNGFLEGKVTIGPLCPVERNPPDPNCLPNEKTYKAWPIVVYDSYGFSVGQLAPNLDGYYKLDLPPGKYVVDLKNKQSLVGRNNLPANIQIVANKTAILDIDIDTGIR